MLTDRYHSHCNFVSLTIFLILCYRDWSEASLRVFLIGIFLLFYASMTEFCRSIQKPQFTLRQRGLKRLLMIPDTNDWRLVSSIWRCPPMRAAIAFHYFAHTGKIIVLRGARSHRIGKIIELRRAKRIYFSPLKNPLNGMENVS